MVIALILDTKIFNLKFNSESKLCILGAPKLAEQLNEVMSIHVRK
jgi:hypothetical protein